MIHSPVRSVDPPAEGKLLGSYCDFGCHLVVDVQILDRKKQLVRDLSSRGDHLKGQHRSSGHAPDLQGAPESLAEEAEALILERLDLPVELYLFRYHAQLDPPMVRDHECDYCGHAQLVQFAGVVLLAEADVLARAGQVPLARLQVGGDQRVGGLFDESDVTLPLV